MDVVRKSVEAYEHASRIGLKFDRASFLDGYVHGFKEGMDEAEKVIGWHPYPKEKPDEETRVFVNICNKYFDSRLFCEDTFGLVDNSVVAWMPIPEYNGGREE